MLSHRYVGKVVLSTFVFMVLVVAAVQPVLAGYWSVTWQDLTGTTPDAPGVYVYQGLDSNWYMAVAVRGSDNGIYYIAGVNVMAPPPGAHGSWIRENQYGTTPSSPAVAYDYSDGTLYLAVRGMDNAIYYRKAATGVWHQLTGATPSGPAIDISSHTMYVLVRGMDNGLYWTTVNLANGVQGSWHQLSGSTPDKPSQFMYGSWMNVAVRGSDNGIYWRRFNTGGLGDSGWQKLSSTSGSAPPGLTTPSGPAIGNSFSQYIYISVRGSDNRIYYIDVLAGSPYTQGNWIYLSPGATSTAPSMSSPTASLHFVVKGMDNHIYATW